MRWVPSLGVFVGLVEFADVTNGVTALLKTFFFFLFKDLLKAFSGAFFFSTSVELKTKGPGGGGAGREIINSNTSLPLILTPRHF